MKLIRVSAGVRNALLAALLFGASAPLDQNSPTCLISNAVGWCTLPRLWRWTSALAISSKIAPQCSENGGGARALCLAMADRGNFSGGVVGPVLLMVRPNNDTGLKHFFITQSGGVLTALLAWFAFRENFDYRIFLGDDRHRSPWVTAVVESRQMSSAFRGERWQLSARVSVGPSTTTSPAKSRNPILRRSQC